VATALAFIAFLALIGVPIYLMWNRPPRHNVGKKDPNFSYGPGDASLGDSGSHHGFSDGGGHGGGGGGDGGGGGHP
jgi:hypothetical protein